MGEIFYKEECYAIIGAAMEVHNQLGCGFQEKVYQDALEIEFKLRNIPFVREQHLPIFYKGIRIKHDYYSDYICYDKIVIECKSVPEILKEHEAQTINYLKINSYKLGLVINFGNKTLDYKRLVN